MNTLHVSEAIAREIFTHPYDLCFFIWGARKGYVSYISRGPVVAPGKLLFTSGPIHPCAQSAIAEVRSLLEGVCQLAKQNHYPTHDPMSYSIGAAFGTLATGPMFDRIFGPVFINHVIDKLRRTHAANTYHW